MSWVEAQPIGAAGRIACRAGFTCAALVAQLSLFGLVIVSGSAVAQGVESGQTAKNAEVPTSAEATAVQTDASGSYTIVAIRKGTEGVHYIRLGEAVVQVRNGVQLKVEREDEDSFYVKRYLSQPRRPVLRPQFPTPSSGVSLVGAADQPTSAPSEPISPLGLVESDALRFESFGRGLPSSGQWRNGFDLADMDSDGDVDLLFGAGRKSRAEPNLFLSDKAGNWQRWDGLYPRLPYDYGDAAAADFNRDGHMDIALAVHLSGVVVLVSDGRGGYLEWSQGIDLVAPQGERAPTVFSSRALEVADWNADGWPDVLALGEGPKGVTQRRDDGSLASSPGLRVFLNQGDGTWVASNTESQLFGDALAVADFSGDGRLDAVTGTRSQRGAGLLHVQTDRGWEQRSLGITVDGQPARPHGAYVFAITVHDLNSDQKVDVVLGSLSAGGAKGETPSVTDLTRVDVLLREGEVSDEMPRWIRRPLFVEKSRTGIYSVAVGDLNGDAVADVAFGTGDGRIEVRLGRGDSDRFTAELSAELPQSVPGCVVYALGLQDLNDDGVSELVAAYAGEAVGLGGRRSVPGCPGEGAVRVWTPRLVSESD